MAAAVVASNAPARPGGAFLTVWAIPVTVTFSATTYTTASGGAPFDLATILNTVGPFDANVNPSDVFQFTGGSAAGHRVDGFAVGTPTYNTNTDSTSARSQNTTLATCPCTFRLWNGTTEIADGAITQTVTGSLLCLRGGKV